MHVKLLKLSPLFIVSSKFIISFFVKLYGVNSLFELEGKNIKLSQLTKSVISILEKIYPNILFSIMTSSVKLILIFLIDE